MFILTHMTDHSLTIMSQLCSQESRDKPGLDRSVKRDKLSCGVRRTSGELGRFHGERSVFIDTYTSGNEM